MKKLNVLWLFALLLALPVGFSSCSDDDEGPGSREELVGTWEETFEKWIYKEDGEIVEQGEDSDCDDYRMRLNSNGTIDDAEYYNGKWQWENNSGKWFYKNGKIGIEYDEEGDHYVEYAKVLELTATKLVIEIEDTYKEDGVTYYDYEYQEYKRVSE